MSAIDKLIPGGFTPASVIDELRAELAERDALRQVLVDVWVIARHHVPHHTLGGEILMQRVAALIAGRKLRSPPDILCLCDAYESGLGHGLKIDGAVNPYAHSWEREAYDIGYQRGKEHRDAMQTKPRPVEIA